MPARRWSVVSLGLIGIAAAVAVWLCGGIGMLAVLAFEGDSISVFPDPQPSLFPELTRSIFSPYASSPNFAMGGSTIADLVARAEIVDGSYDATRLFNVLVVFVGANDLTRGHSANAIVSDLQAYCQARRARGWQVVLGTLLPQNIERCRGGACEPTRLAVNASLRRDASFYDALADVGSDPIMGTYASTLDATYYLQPDGNHPTNPTGQAMLARHFQRAFRMVIADRR